jgi:6-phosphofructokinase 2
MRRFDGLKRIVTLTLNPAVDASCSTRRVRPLHKVRTTNERFDAGGGGINVARVVNELGGRAFAVFLAGDTPGDVLEDLVHRAGVLHHRIGIKESTRVSHVVYEEDTGQEFRFTPEGPAITEDEWHDALAILELLDIDYLVASGSLPRGVPVDVYARLARDVKARGGKLVLDTSGPALAAALEEGVFLVKPSRGEFATLMGHELDDLHSLEDAAMELIGRGQTQLLAVTLGHDGALIASAEGVKWLVPPEVEVKSAVGAGDSFVGGMVHGLSTGESLERAFALGVAAGTATVLTSGTELCRKADVLQFWDQLCRDLS